MSAEQTRTPTAVGALAVRLRPRLPELAERVVTLILQQEPAYREVTAVTREELGASVRGHLEQLVAKLTDPGAETLPYLTSLSALGRRRVEQGLPLDSLLHAFRIGARTIWQGLREEAERLAVADSSALVEAATAIWELHEAVSERVAAAYRDVELAVLRRREQERDALVDGLLEGRGQEAAFAREVAFGLRLPLSGRFVVVVAEPGTDGEDPLAGAERALTGQGFSSAWRSGPPRSIGVVELGDADLQALRRALTPLLRGRLGVSTVVRSLAELPAALQLAETALESLPLGCRQVGLLADRLPAALLAASPRVAGVLVEQMLGPLSGIDPDERDRLLVTLEAYTETGGSATDTAQRVFCHRNTVLKRLRRFEELTGHCLAEPATRLAVGLAVKAVPIIDPGRLPAPVTAGW